jgi:large subunit ribosomal protein L18
VKTDNKVVARRRRHARVRKRLAGNAERPRLAVFRSNKHIYAQIIDDESGRTLAAASSVGPEGTSGSKSASAKRVGELVGQRAKEAGVTAVVFDRGGFRFMGRVREVAEGAREAGLKF